MIVSQKDGKIVIELSMKESDDFGRSLFYIIKGIPLKFGFGTDDVYTIGQTNQLIKLYQKLFKVYNKRTKKA